MEKDQTFPICFINTHTHTHTHTHTYIYIYIYITLIPKINKNNAKKKNTVLLRKGSLRSAEAGPAPEREDSILKA